jgi:hypothetical protein
VHTKPLFPLDVRAQRNRSLFALWCVREGAEGAPLPSFLASDVAGNPKLDSLRTACAIRTGPREIKFTAAALGLALGTTIAFLVMPAYSGDGGEETLIDHEGAWVTAILAIPIAIAAAPLIVPARSRRLALRIASGVCVAFVLATGFTVGLFYAPTAVLLMVAASGAPRTTER